MSLFPIIQPIGSTAKPPELPMAREAAWDFENDRAIMHGGEPASVTGLGAVKVWAWNALNTARRIWDIWTWRYGSDMEALIGMPFTSELKTSEAARYVRECLEQSPYITEVADVAVDFSDGLLAVAATIRTIYGEARINV